MIKFKQLRRSLGMNVVEIDGTLYIDGSPYNPTTLAPLGDNYRQGPGAVFPNGATADACAGWLMVMQRITYSATPSGIISSLSTDYGGGCSEYMNAGLLANGTPNYVPPQAGESFVVVAGGGGLGAKNTFFKRDRATMDAVAAYSSWFTSLDQQNLVISSWLPSSNGSYTTTVQSMNYGGSQISNAAADFTTSQAVYVGAQVSQTFSRTIAGILGSYAVVHASAQQASSAQSATVAVINRQSKAYTSINAAITGAASVDHCGIIPSHIVNETTARGYYYVAESTTGADNIVVSTITVDTVPGTPTATLAACTFDWSGNGGVTAFPVMSRTQPSARKIRSSIIDRTATVGKTYLLVTISEPPASSLEAQVSHVGVLFEITGKNALKFVQKFSIADNARAWHTMFTSDNHDRLIVRQSDRIAIYKFTDGVFWQKVNEYAGQFIAIGVDSLERIWLIEAGSGGNFGSNGATLYYINPEALPNSVSVAFDNSLYTFNGAAINTNARVNVYNSSGVRVAQPLNLAITSGNATFAGGSATTSVTTSNSADTVVPIVINGIGDVLMEAST